MFLWFFIKLIACSDGCFCFIDELIVLCFILDAFVMYFV